MGRPVIFPADTVLYHPTEGRRLFPRGEQDPGPLWTETPAGAPVGDKSLAQALQDLIEAQDRIEELGDQLKRKDFDLTRLAEERDAAVAALNALRKDVEDERAATAQKAEESAPATTPAPEAAKASDAPEIPADWRDLPWTKPNDAGLTLRGLAASFSDTPINDKADAIAAIEAELARRAV